MLCHHIERLSKVTSRRDIVTTQRHNELPEHHQIFLDQFRWYGHPRDARRDGGIIREHVRKPA